MLEQFKNEIVVLISYLLDPNKRLFLGYVFSALFFAFGVYFVRNKQPSAKGFLKFAFNPSFS